jgi:hypothetical protein
VVVDMLLLMFTVMVVMDMVEGVVVLATQTDKLVEVVTVLL